MLLMRNLIFLVIHLMLVLFAYVRDERFVGKNTRCICCNLISWTERVSLGEDRSGVLLTVKALVHCPCWTSHPVLLSTDDLVFEDLLLHQQLVVAVKTRVGNVWSKVVVVPQQVLVVARVDRMVHFLIPSIAAALVTVSRVWPLPLIVVVLIQPYFLLL